MEIKNVDLTPLNRLGKKQKEVLKLLAKGWHISIFTNFSEGTEEIELSDEANEDTLAINPYILISFYNRGLLFYQTIYKTVLPDTEIAHYKLKQEYIEVVKHWKQ